MAKAVKSLPPVELSCIQSAQQSIRFFVVSSDGKVALPVPKSLTEVENGTPLFLGTDLLDYTVNHHLLKNGHRIHARYAKEGVATKLTLADFRVEGISQSRTLYAYNIQGLFQIVFSMHDRRMQRDCLLKLKDEWLKYYEQINMEESMLISIDSKSTSEASLTKDKVGILSTKENHSSTNQKLRTSRKRSNNSDSDVDTRTKENGAVKNASSPVTCSSTKAPVVEDHIIKEYSGIRCDKSTQTGHISQICSALSDSLNRNYGSYAGGSTSPSVGTLAAKDYKDTQGISEQHNDSFNSTGQSDLRLNKNEQFDVKSSENGQLDLECNKKIEFDLKLNKVEEIESNRVGHSNDEDRQDDNVRCGVEEEMEVCNDMPNQLHVKETSTVMNTQNIVLIFTDSSSKQNDLMPNPEKEKYFGHGLDNTNSYCRRCRDTMTNEDSQLIYDDKTAPVTCSWDSLIQILVTFIGSQCPLEVTEISEIVTLTLEMLKVETMSNDRAIDFNLFKIYLKELQNTNDTGYIDDEAFELSRGRSIFLMVLCKYIGTISYSLRDNIEQRVKEFKQEHINCIDNLPPPKIIIDQIFPSFMRILISTWMAGDSLSEETQISSCHGYSLHAEHSYWDDRGCPYPLIQLILELVNNSLISGTAHVVLSAIK